MLYQYCLFKKNITNNIQINHERLEYNGTHKLLVYGDVKAYTEVLLDGRNELILEVNTEETEVYFYILLPERRTEL
jgi:hypothetical protein